ncbi:MAG: ABC transporter substrate-binding protein [Chloroflexi bacterium]|nr:ABC transporter substrate-binding protein [Chloroflexota bacterium]
MLTACASAVVEEKAEKVAPKEEVVAPKEEVVVPKEEVVVPKKGVAEPQYGGTLTLMTSSDMGTTWDSNSYLARTPHSWDYKIAHEQLLVPDPLKGPAGTKAWKGMASIKFGPELFAGNLAESWEIAEPDTMKFKIRKGVYWQNRPPVNGAELTPEDVVYNYIYFNGHQASIQHRLYPYFGLDFKLNLENLRKVIYVDPDDPRTVVFKGDLGNLWMNLATFHPVMWRTAFGPLEDALKGPGYGGWRGVVGTGAMILTDYVMDSVITFERNPNYWKKDPLHPQNQLPYIDRMKILIIPDLSTQQAALRTGKIDVLTNLKPDDARSLMKTNPELLSASDWSGSVMGFHLRHDVKPIDDVRVRRALQMAINRDEIINDYYGGEAIKWFWPAFPHVEIARYMVPFEEMPRDVQELYEYHPDKAKQLLAEAGYPDGFQTSVTVSSTSTEDIEVLQIIQAYWAKVGVKLELDIKDPTIAATMRTKFTYKGGYAGGQTVGAEFDLFVFSHPANQWNLSRSNVPLIDEVYRAVMKNYFNPEEKARIYRENYADMHRAVIRFLLAIPKIYSLWQPWLGGYYGEQSGARYLSTLPAFASEYAWIDQELKKAMGR